jgi:N-acetylglucosamine kinase-like BadF-type ATPase
MVTSNREIVVAVDGGQSSTLALAAALNGEILGVGWGGESNHIDEPGGVERLNNALNHSITGALASAGRDADTVRGAVLGMTGVSTLAGEIAQAMLPQAQVMVHHDAITALAGASVGQPGVIVIAGTGAVAYGELADGRSAKSGGWGYLMGDEGSGYDLGIQALRAITQASDWRGTSTQLVDMIPQHFGLDDLQALHKAIYSQQITRAQIAGLAAVVGRAAQAGDTAAQDLLKAAAQHLAQAALAVIRQLGVPGMDVYTTGGLFNAGEWVLSPFREAIQIQSPASTVSAAKFSPIIGALLLALKAAGSPLDASVIEQIRDSAPDAAISKQAKENG